MNDIECVCPECGGRLYSWEEFSFVRRRMVAKDGRLLKKVTKGEESESDNWGIECVDCGFSESGTKYGWGVDFDNPIINKIFDRISLINSDENDNPIED